MKLTDLLKEAGISGKVFSKQAFTPELNEASDKIQVRGIGTYDYKSLTSNLARKIKDLDKRNKKGDHTGIGKNQLGVLVAMWEALSDYEENH